VPIPQLNRIVESALFVKDLGKARTFYQEVLGLRPFSDSEAGCGFEVAKGQLLLLVTSEKAHQPSPTPGGTVPACLDRPGEAVGAGHVAFAVDPQALDEWRDHLVEQAVPVLSDVSWARGGRSLYFRDPDGHVLELASPGVWDVY
jgi:catechol 2,3-dioxygenase-like lactoylglutathione lyase family enzyme